MASKLQLEAERRVLSVAVASSDSVSQLHRAVCLSPVWLVLAVKAGRQTGRQADRQTDKQTYALHRQTDSWGKDNSFEKRPLVGCSLRLLIVLEFRQVRLVDHLGEHRVVELLGGEVGMGVVPNATR